MNIRRCAEVSVKTQSTAVGSFVALQSRRIYLTANEADELALALVRAAQKVREAEIRPCTRLLPFSDEFRLEEGVA